MKGSQQLFNLLHAIGEIGSHVEFSTWQVQWQDFFDQHNVTAREDLDQLFTSLNEPFPIHIKAIKNIMKQMQTALTEIIIPLLSSNQSKPKPLQNNVIQLESIS